MLNKQVYYHGTTKKAIIAFGNLFNDLHIERYGAAGDLQQRIKVPISYAPKEKFLAREQQQPDIDGAKVEVILPRLAFEITGFERDKDRQMNALQTRRAVINGAVASAPTPVPYNLNVTLYAIAKTQDDALQIMEQIVPMFTPTYTLTINAIPEIGLTDDLPITLESISHEDDYDAAFVQRRQIIWVFNFVISMNYFGYVENNQPVIKRTEVTLYNNPEMRDEQRIELISNEVVPFEASKEDDHTILTEIEGF